MHQCNHCGSTVTASFARVFGDREGLVHGCPHCGDDEAALVNTRDSNVKVVERG